MKKILTPIVAVLATLAANAQQASYDLPATLSYYGTIDREEGIPFPAANFVTTNPINDGAWIWVPVGAKVYFRNSSEVVASSYKWTVPGADNAETEDLIATYSTPGTYAFPTLTAEYKSGTQTFTRNLKIKVGGEAELCHSDTREWGKTYALGYAPFIGGGYLGGSNNVNIAGVGNFYHFSSPDMYVDAVNIYAAKQPKNVGDAEVRVRVFLPYLGDNLIMTYLGPLEGDNIPMTNYKTRDDDGVYTPVKDYAVYTLDFTNPLNCEGFPYLFFAVEGFASNPAAASVTEDFVIATDVDPARTLPFEDYNNALAHNSFVRSSGESDYLRPVSVYGGSKLDFASGDWKSYNFWICPIVRGAETPAGIEDIVTDSNTSDITVTRDGNLLLVNGVTGGVVSVYSINGVCKMSAEAANGGAIFNVSGLDNGIYVITTSDGVSCKFVK